MRFEFLITLTAGFVVFGTVTGDLCAQSKELRKSRKNLNQKYNTVVVEELRYCDEGYVERFCNENYFVCEPVCPAGCENGTCIAPDICICAEGFELHVNVDNAECVPLTMDNYVRHTRAASKEESHDLDTCRKSCDSCWKHNYQDDCLQLCGPTKNSSIVKIYTCDIKKTAPIYHTGYSNKWILIGGFIFIGLMLIAIVYLCVRIYQTRHETGAHDIPISLLMKF